ncbi:hypothetical protein PV797_09170 [Clostridiaceae bacterium M8S5]|nr:hypothetical protein PV797_09170 [Clostridiaceae bacterium M8S5]
MSKIKLYNVIFPLWMILFLPPVIFVTICGNFIIDLLVLILCYYIYKVKCQYPLKTFCFKNIFKVFIFGFVADFIGALLLFVTVTLFDDYLPNGITNSIMINPFSNIYGFMIVALAMLIVGFLIYILNHRFTFKYIEDAMLRFKLSLTIAIITIPWTFMIPMKKFF